MKQIRTEGVKGEPMTDGEIRAAALRAVERDRDRGPRIDTSSEVGSLPDNKEGRYEGHDG